MTIDRAPHLLACLGLLAVFSLVIPRSVAAQNRGNTAPLGMVSEIPVSFMPSLPTVIHFNNDPYPDILCYNQETRQIVVLINKGSGESFEEKPIGEATDVTFLAAQDFNGDGKEDIVIVHREASQVEVWLSSPTDSVYSSTKYPVNFYPEKVLLADIDNDSTTDILCFGKLSSGISVLRGNKDGTFREKTLILPEIPVIDASVIKLNDDDFPDLVIHNWLTNEMVFYYGMGELQFSEQNIVSFGQDTVNVAFGDFNRDKILDYAVTSSQGRSIRFFAGDGMATYFQYQNLEYGHETNSILAAPVSSKLGTDILSFDGKDGIFGVFQNQGDGTFYDEVVFGCPLNATASLVGDFDNDGWNDLLVVDGPNKMLTCYWNARKRLRTGAETSGIGGKVSFAVGRKPLGLVVSDLNDDGLDDIAVVNDASSTLSLLFSSQQNRMSGQISFPTVDNPSSIRLYSKNDTSLTFLLTHESIAKVSVLSLSMPNPHRRQRPVSPYTYAISTAENPRMFMPDAALQNQAIEFYIYSTMRQRSLSYFRQVSGARFVERNFKPIIPARILAGSVNDFNDDGRPDLGYIYFDTDSLRYNLGITFSDSTGQYRGKTLSYIFPDSVMKRCYMLFADLNGDNNPDCILYSTPTNSIRIALGKGAGRFGEFVTVIDTVHISDPEQLQVVDFDGDGINDLVALDDQTSELFFFKGKGNGRFLPGTFLIDIPKGAMFRFGDFNGNGKLDIVYTEPEHNVVTVYFAHGASSK
ncbi:MAG TPA: VCBS repeat-containing protein [Bacteroidota bacterium]|nr:VCBS repeat-containing protein [Bacteroidota bacterium]